MASPAGIELYHHQPESHQQNFNKVLEGHRPGPIDLTFQSSVSIPTLENFYFYSRKIWIIDFSFHSRNSRPEFQISHSTLEIRDQNFTFLFLLSKFEIRILYFSFYSRNSRPEFQISLSTLEIRDQNFKFLFLLSKFEIRILNFSFYSGIYFFDSCQCLNLSPPLLAKKQ